MNDLDLLIARAQIAIAKRTLSGFMVMLILLLVLLVWPEIKASPEIISLVSAATGSLGTILAQQNGYFFARHRPPTELDGDSSPPLVSSPPANPAISPTETKK